MQLSEQVDFLTSLGRRLDDWVSPGDPADVLFGKLPLVAGPTALRMRYPARVADVLLARWIVIKDYDSQADVACLPNPAQLDFSKRRTGRDVICKAGRIGFTAYIGLLGFLRTITNYGHTSLQVAHEQKPSEDYFSQVDHAWKMFPGELGNALRAGALRRDKASVREMKFPALNSRYFVETAGDQSAAIGEGFQFLLCTEVARWRKGDPKQVMSNLLSHLTGTRTEVYLESRPFGDIGEFHERYQAAKRGESEFRAHFYQWWWHPGHVRKLPEGFSPTSAEAAIVARYAEWRKNEAPSDCGLPAALRETQIAWRRAQERELHDKLAQEFAEDDISCFLGGGNCPFSATGMETILADFAPVVAREQGAGESENGFLAWKQPEPGREYVLFIDPASGLHRSRAAIEVIDLDTGEQVAEWVGRVDYETCGPMARRYATHYNMAWIAPENNLGRASATIIASLAGYPNIYKHVGYGPTQVGWPTDAKTRPEMLDRLGYLIAESPHLFHSRRLVAELKNCERAGDRIQARKGETDDIVMAMAGAHSARFELKKRSLQQPWVETITINPDRSERGWYKIS